MQGSFRSRISFALAAALAVTACAYDTAYVVAQKRWRDTVATAVSVIISLRDWIVDAVVTPLRALMRDVRAWLVLAGLPKLTAARQYLRREVERARIFATWRMCPST